ncbi:MAG: adenylate/guanylate cyclase domain-containing protein [Planctomycetota bacterium]|nr:adenylate/guanylate cyclase domain-containing protein [Planctomycetota bacterium]
MSKRILLGAGILTDSPAVSNRAGYLVRLCGVNFKVFLPRGVIARRIVAALAIAFAAWLVALIASVMPILQTPFRLADNVFYDDFYHRRTIEDQTGGPVVIIAVSQADLDAVDKTNKFGWPWPREYWGAIAGYLDKCGAKAIAFDLVFSETSVYQNSTGDDDTFGGAIAAIKTPVVFGSFVNADGSFVHFAPPIPKPNLAAVNVNDDRVFRQYTPQVHGRASLATAAVQAAKTEPRLPLNHPLLLHYYGPHITAEHRTTFTYISAARLLAAAIGTDATAKAAGITPEQFRGKIVLIGIIAVGGYDLKASPLSAEYPGVEVQATAAANLLAGQSVEPVSSTLQALSGLIASVIAALGIVFPRRALLKLLGPILAIISVLGFGIYLFIQPEIRWLAPTVPLLAVGIATIGAFSWTYFAEDRQRRFMLKALSKVVSPAVAEQLAREPQRLALGTTRRSITLLFTDLADFTNMSESMDVQALGQLLNRYLGAMSDQVLLHEGTLDKYIGDAIMCFWNAPLPQDDHAAQACRAALAIAAKEDEIRVELQSLGAPKLFTRIGINTTDAAVGFVGSSHLFNYTALGDGVNLASRLEGANKLYGSKILLSNSTADLVRDQFIMRKLDVVKVKGKTQPMAVYELLAENTAAADNAVKARLAKGYEAALENYTQQNWNAAEQALLELLAEFKDDGPSMALLRRVVDLRINPPPPEWDGVYTAKEK